MPTSVYDELRNAIVTGTLPPGSPLVETALASQYGMSRTPIREALHKLRQDGLVEPSGRGLAVRHQSPEDILEIYEIRVLLEEFATRAAAVQRSELDLNRLVRIQREMVELPPDDVAGRVQLGNDFHEQVWASSHNRTVMDLLGRINISVQRYASTTLHLPDRWETVLAEHDRIIDAIRRRQPDDAAKLAAEHMSEARDVRLRMYAEQA
jgi:DNA-binding GntR family transcriptional regulator